MRGRVGRWFVALGAASFLVTGVTPAGAGAGESPSSEFCGAFNEYYAVQFLVALAESFSEFDDEDGGDGENVGTEILLALSPKLERSTETMLESPPKALEKGLKRQLKVWRKGVDLLRDDVGLSADAIAAIAELDLETSSPDAEDVLGEEVSDKKLKAAARKYTDAVDSLDEATTRKGARALAQAATDCGIVPDPDVDCTALVTDEEATALLGELSDTSEGEGCSWVGAEVEEGSEPALAVEVFTTDLAYERLTGLLAGTGEAVPALGEQAAVFEGYSSQTLGGTSGRTLIAVVDGRTLQMALRLGDAEVTTDQLVALANQVIGRL